MFYREPSSGNGALRGKPTWRQIGSVCTAASPFNTSPPWIDVSVPPLPIVIAAEHRGAYRIHLRFSDGVEGTVDFREWLSGPIFEPLKNLAYFGRFFID